MSFLLRPGLEVQDETRAVAQGAFQTFKFALSVGVVASGDGALQIGRYVPAGGRRLHLFKGDERYPLTTLTLPP